MKLQNYGPPWTIIILISKSIVTMMILDKTKALEKALIWYIFMASTLIINIFYKNKANIIPENL